MNKTEGWGDPTLKNFKKGWQKGRAIRMMRFPARDQLK